MMEQQNIEEADFTKAELYHKLLEAVKVAYVAQSNIADPVKTKFNNIFDEKLK